MFKKYPNHINRPMVRLTKMIESDHIWRDDQWWAALENLAFTQIPIIDNESIETRDKMALAVVRLTSLIRTKGLLNPQKLRNWLKFARWALKYSDKTDYLGWARA